MTAIDKVIEKSLTSDSHFLFIPSSSHSGLGMRLGYLDTSNSHCAPQHCTCKICSTQVLIPLVMVGEVCEQDCLRAWHRFPRFKYTLCCGNHNLGNVVNMYIYQTALIFLSFHTLQKHLGYFNHIFRLSKLCQCDQELLGRFS